MNAEFSFQRYVLPINGFSLYRAIASYMTQTRPKERRQSAVVVEIVINQYQLSTIRGNGNREY